MSLTCGLLVGFIAMRFALGTPDILKEEAIMNKRDCRLAQECVKLAIFLAIFVLNWKSESGILQETERRVSSSEV